MATINLKVGDPVRYSGSPWYEGRIVGPASNGYVGWFRVYIYASSLPCRVGTYQDFAEYALRSISMISRHEKELGQAAILICGHDLTRAVHLLRDEAAMPLTKGREIISWIDRLAKD